MVGATVGAAVAHSLQPTQPDQVHLFSQGFVEVVHTFLQGGPAVGDAVGVAVGAAVGGAVGAAVGGAVGATVGGAVGATVGAAVGGSMS